MPKPTSAAETVPVRVVVVTMDSHLAGAMERASHDLARRIPGLSLRMHAAAEWGTDPTALDRCRADIAQGDIVVATMLFMRSFPPVLPALQRGSIISTHGPARLSAARSLSDPPVPSAWTVPKWPLALLSAEGSESVSSHTLRARSR